MVDAPGNFGKKMFPKLDDTAFFEHILVKNPLRNTCWDYRSIKILKKPRTGGFFK
jgi:hypothetical protein